MSKKKLQLTVVLMCLISVGLFAGSLWNQADAIADNSSNIVPSLAEITLTETNGYGIAVTEDKATLMMDETRSGRLTSRFFGDSDLEELFYSYSDGLIFTPFSSDVDDFDDLEATGNIAKIDGETCQEYYYEVTVDENELFYNYYGEDTGRTIDFSGYVWISVKSGAPLKIENDYTIGDFDIEQTIEFAEVNGKIIPETITTNGTETKISKLYGILELTDFVVEENISEVFTASSYSR